MKTLIPLSLYFVSYLRLSAGHCALAFASCILELDDWEKRENWKGRIATFKRLRKWLPTVRLILTYETYFFRLSYPLSEWCYRLMPQSSSSTKLIKWARQPWILPFWRRILKNVNKQFHMYLGWIWMNINRVNYSIVKLLNISKRQWLLRTSKLRLFYLLSIQIQHQKTIMQRLKNGLSVFPS